jgi:hypothetical protein
VLAGTSEMHGEIKICVIFYLETLIEWEDNIKMDKN